jgi:hypothetical protein
LRYTNSSIGTKRSGTPTLIKAQQDGKLETKVMNNSERTGYKKNPRRIYGPDYTPKTVAVEMTV